MKKKKEKKHKTHRYSQTNSNNHLKRGEVDADEVLVLLQRPLVAETELADGFHHLGRVDLSWHAKQREQTLVRQIFRACRHLIVQPAAKGTK